MNNSILKSLLIEYDKKRINAENIAQKEKENLYTEFPELEEIDKKLSSLAFSSMIELTKNNDKKIIENLNSNIEALKKEKEKILNSIGERAKKIIPNYECKKCNDTGYILNGNSTEMCSCLKQKIYDIEYNKSNMSNLEKQNFNNFNLNFYSDEINKQKYNSDISPRENIKLIKNICDKFINNFDNTEQRNLLFTGNTGLGKTFLSSCIANELLKKDIYEHGAVVYNNLVYPIVVPDCRKTSLDSTDWKTDFENHDKRITKGILEFVVGSLSGMSFDDNTDLKSQGIYAGPVILNNIKSEKKVDCMLGSIFSSIEGVSNNLEKVYDDIKINIILQSSTSQRRAFIQAGTYKNSSIYNQYAGSIPYSAFWDSCGGFTFSGSVMSNNISKVYKTLTGDTTDYGTYDINILVDKRHKDEEYSSYLWINKEKKLVENPKIYSGDRVEIVQLNFLGSRKKSLYSLPINTTCKVSNEYRAFFDDFMTDNNLKWCV